MQSHDPPWPFPIQYRILVMPTPVAALIVCRSRAYSPKLKLEQLLRFVAVCQILVDFLPQDWNLQAQAAAASCSWTQYEAKVDCVGLTVINATFAFIRVQIHLLIPLNIYCNFIILLLDTHIITFGCACHIPKHTLPLPAPCRIRMMPTPFNFNLLCAA